MDSQNISKRDERRTQLQRHQQEQQRWIVIGLIVLGAVFIVLAIIWPLIKQPPDGPSASAPTAGQINTVTLPVLPNPNGLSLGDPHAPATIDVFEDFQCPACKYFTESIETLVVQNLVATGKARYIFHNYPFLDGGSAREGGESDQASNASMCANEQGKFWEMHATIFANWKGENEGAYNDSRLQLMAENIGLDMKSFKDCFTAKKYLADIQADLDLGAKMGVTGTPTVFVNGKRAGEQGKIATYDDIAKAVEQVGNK